MYQVLQVYASFLFSLFNNFLLRSIKVGQALSRRCCLKVAATSPQSRGDVIAIFPQSPWTPAGLGDIAESPSSRIHLVAATLL